MSAVPAVADSGSGLWAPTAPDPGDAGHATPAWLAGSVQLGAADRRRALAGHERRRSVPDRTIAARSHGGLMPGGPRLGVIHSAETPLQAGYAYSIAANWFATEATTSATVMIDPAETIRLLPDNVVAYHVGPEGNGFTVGVEQAGRGSMTRAEWTSPDGLAQGRRVAAYMRECRDRWALPLRWASDAEIRRAKTDPGFRAGWCTHDDVRRVLGGTTHTDPGAGYDRPWLMDLATREDDVALSDDDAVKVARTLLDLDLGGGATLAAFVKANSKLRDPKGATVPVYGQVLDVDLGGGSLADYVRAQRGTKR